MSKVARTAAILVLGFALAVVHALVSGASGVSAQSCSYQSTVLADSPVAYWRLGETSGPAVNISSLGSAVDGSYHGDAVRGVSGLVPRDPDLAVHGFVDIPNHNEINTNGPYNAKTIELWFEAYYAQVSKQVLYEQGDTTHGLNIFLDGDQLTVGAWANNEGNWVHTTVAPGTIYHVAMVFDGSTETVTGYLDGESFGTLATGFSSIPSHSGGIGISIINDDTRFSSSNTAAGGLYFDGDIDEVALYNHALSPTQILLHARGCTLTGPAVDVAKDGPVTASISDGVPYTFTVTNIGDVPLQNVRVEDDYTGNATGNFLGGDDDSDSQLDLTEAWVYTADYTVQPADPNPLINTVTVTATNAFSAEATNSNTHALYILSTQGCDYQINVLDDNPIAYWPLAEVTGPATNVSSLGNVPDGTYQNGVTRGVNGLMPGARNAAASFDGTNDYVSLHSHNEINASGPYLEKTIELWFNADSLIGKQILFEEGGNINGLNIFLDNSLLYVGAWANYSGNWISTTIVADAVYHVVLVYDGNAQRVTGYLDGVSFGSHAVDFTSIPTHPGQIGIGSIDVDTRYSNSEEAISLNGAHFDGIIDDLALYNHVLPEERIQLHSGGCPAPDLSLSKDDGDASATPGGVVTYTLSYSNTGDLDADGVVITETVPDNTAFNAVASSVGWQKIGASNTYTFYIGNLDVSDSGSVTFAVTVDDPLPPDATQITNTASIADDRTNGPDQNNYDNQASDTTQIEFAPALSVEKIGPSSANVGQAVTYTFYVTNNATNGDGSPISAISVIDDVAGPATLVSGGGLLELGETWVYTTGYTIRATDPNPLVNTVTVTGKDQNGDDVTTASDVHSTTLGGFAPALRIDADWPTTAQISETIVYTFTVSHDLAGDGSPVSNVTLGDTVVGPIIRASGDDGDDRLEDSESWVYTAAYTIQNTDPDPLTNTVTLSAQDQNPDDITLNANYSLDIDSPDPGDNRIFLPLILVN